MQFWTLDEIEQHAMADHEVGEEISPGVTITRRRILQVGLAGAAAAAGAPIFDARSIIERIGQPDFQQVLAAAALTAALPRNVARAARSPEWAADVLFYTLIDADPEIRQRQLLAIAGIMGEDSEQRVRALHQAAGAVRAEQPLPLPELAFPQIRQRPPEFIGRVLRAVKALAEADHEMDPFEFLLARSISMQLWEAHNPDRVRLAGDRALRSSLPAAADVLAVLARHGEAGDAGAEAAFQAGWRELGEVGEFAMPRTDDWVGALDRALPELDRLRAALRGLAGGVRVFLRRRGVRRGLLRRADLGLLHAHLLEHLGRELTLRHVLGRHADPEG